MKTKKNFTFLLVAVLFWDPVFAQEMNNTALFTFLREEDRLAVETGETCDAQGRTYQELSFEEQVDQALSIYDTASVIETAEQALDQMIQASKNYPQEWLGFYWTAHLYGQVGRVYDDNDKYIDFMEKAHKNLQQAWKLNPNPTSNENSELLILESLLYRLSGFTLYNPRKKVDIDKKKADRYVSKSLDYMKSAEEANPNNPRVYLQKAIVSVYNGNYEQGIKEFNTSLDLYDKYPATSKIHPNWGKGWIKVWLPRAEKLLEQQKANN